ncbi:hypothetical protein EBU71_07380 [bacterium]|nr:hypothetical protein [Candidatus Elulimicrobium humile]
MSYQDKDISAGTKWISPDHKVFQVIDVVEIENQIWVYYRKYNSHPDDCREFSCFKESFLLRFTKIINE